MAVSRNFTFGVIGVLLEAASLVGQIGPLLDFLDRTITFRISPELRNGAVSAVRATVPSSLSAFPFDLWTFASRCPQPF